MRALGLTVLLLLGLGLGVIARPAGAAPCPHHAHGMDPAASGQHAPRHGGDTGAAAAAAMAGMLPAPGGAAAVSATPDAGLGHAVPHGALCCLAAMAGAVALALVPEPCRLLVAARVPAPRSWLPPWAVPASGIFRPPALLV